MMKIQFAYIIMFFTLLLGISNAQEHPLPLKITSIQSNYVEDIFSHNLYEFTSDDQQIQKIIGLRYEIIIDFEVEDQNFFLNPTFRVYMSDWYNDIILIDIDRTKIVSQNRNRMSIEFEVVVDNPSWLNFYCFPNLDSFHPASIWDLKKGTDIQISVYLK